MIHADHGLLCHVDAQPDEQVNKKDPESIHSLVGLIGSSDAGLPGLLQYKDTRTTARKIAAANRLTRAIEEKHLSPIPTICSAPRSSWNAFGNDILASATALSTHVEKVDGGYEVAAGRVVDTVAMALGLYSTGLALIGLRAGIVAKKWNTGRVTLLLDPLPLDIGPAAMELLQILTVHPSNYESWAETHADFDVETRFGTMASYRANAASDEVLEPKQHPNAILTDWIARSFNAAADGDSWLQQGNDRTEEQRKAVTGPFFALHKRGLAKVVPLQNLSLA
ncbi:MAG: hypothetical protein DRJ50_04390 [Actinobacteria bacterium]|nr:MAG: hypothetical protein DRJ50_04390 [Actinomycetota bacterium]